MLSRLFRAEHSASNMWHSIFLSAIVLLLCSGCGHIPRWAPTVEGQVLDARTGEPVSEALVVVGFWYETLLNLTRVYDEQWVDVDRDGKFLVAGHFRDFPPSWSSTPSRMPFVQIVHPDLGYFMFVFEEFPYVEPIDFPGYRAMEFSIEPSEDSLLYLQSPAYFSRMCGNLSREVCSKVCEVAYGSVDACVEAGLEEWLNRRI